MEIMVKEIGEIIQFGVLIDDNVLYLEKVNTKENIEIVSSVGKKIPAVYTALGKALLSGLNDEKIIKMYKDYHFVKYTENTIMSLDELLSQINLVRKRGYATEKQEYTKNTSCVAIPIKENGVVKAAMSATYPNFRETKNTESEIAKILLKQGNVLENIIRVQNLKLDFNY